MEEGWHATKSKAMGEEDRTRKSVITDTSKLHALELALLTVVPVAGLKSDAHLSPSTQRSLRQENQEFIAIFTNGEIKASLGCMRPSLKAGKEKLSLFEQVSWCPPRFSTFGCNAERC